MPDNTQEQRRSAFRALFEGDGYTSRDWDDDPDIEEQPDNYLREGGWEIGRFCCVTIHAGKFFYLPTFSNRHDAQERAVRYSADDIFEESPVKVVDLDTGRVFEPRWDAVPWWEPNPINFESAIADSVNARGAT